MNIPSLAASFALAAALVATPASAQLARTVQGVVINVGIVSAIAAQHVDAQHGMHQGGHGSGMEHVIVSLADEKTGARLAGAEVAVEVRNPKGKVQRKRLTSMVTSGYPDYSEVFQFGWSGKYTMRLFIKPKGAAEPIQTRFTLNRFL